MSPRESDSGPASKPSGASPSAPLPDVLAIFPLAGVLLLPGGRLPLNIFEPRYLSMVSDALGRDRMIGMVQPVEAEAATGAGSAGDRAAVFDTGCAGRITDFSETGDGRFLITLAGVCRFRIARELAMEKGYRRVKPDWTPFLGDLDEGPSEIADRGRLEDALKAYFELTGIGGDWDQIRESQGAALVTALAIICPFEASEKQALLESAGPDERARLLIQLMEMAIHEGSGAGSQARH